MSFRQVAAMLLILGATLGFGSLALAQDADPPQVVTPLRVQSDPNGVNIVDGRTTMDTPTISIPADPRLTYSRIQDLAPYVSKNYSSGDPDTQVASYSVHTGSGSSENFRCDPGGGNCESVIGTGSTIDGQGNTFYQAGTYAIYHFTLTHLIKTPTNPHALRYASSVVYPDGETITYSYQSYVDPGDYLNRTWYRPTAVTSNLGYTISIAYQGNTFGTNEWNTPSQVTLYKTSDPGTPLARLTYSANSITDLNNRVYQCTGCNNSLGLTEEAWAGSLQLPGESSQAKQITQSSSGTLVGAAIKDGVQWSYGYTNPTFWPAPNSYTYSKVTVTAPDGYNVQYNLAYTALTPQYPTNYITSIVDSLTARPPINMTQPFDLPARSIPNSTRSISNMTSMEMSRRRRPRPSQVRGSPT